MLLRCYNKPQHARLRHSLIKALELYGTAEERDAKILPILLGIEVSFASSLDCNKMSGLHPRLAIARCKKEMVEQHIFSWSEAPLLLGDCLIGFFPCRNGWQVA